MISPCDVSYFLKSESVTFSQQKGFRWRLSWNFAWAWMGFDQEKMPSACFAQLTAEGGLVEEKHPWLQETVDVLLGHEWWFSLSVFVKTIFENSLLFSFSLVMGDPTCLLLRNI